MRKIRAIISNHPISSNLVDLCRYIGRKRIDFPVVNTSSAMGSPVVPIARIRFNCIRALEVREFTYAPSLGIEYT